MDDDIELFILFTERSDFDKDTLLYSALYPHENRLECNLLELCCYHGAVNCFKLLISKFNSYITLKCLKFSFLGGNPDIMYECLKKQKPDDDCMKYAIISHNIDFITFLMNEHNIEIEIEYCCIYHNIQAFFVYLDQTNDINRFFSHSPCFGIQSLCEYFLSHGADINAKDDLISGITPLHIAADYNYNEIAEYLISQGADINSQDSNGWNPLHYASMNNKIETAEFFITHCIDINANDNNGDTALHWASNGIRKEMTELLILNGTDVNLKDNRGRTALFIAIENERKEIVELLISHGSNINEQDVHGYTPLHLAAINNLVEIAEILISHGSDKNIRDYHNKTALSYAYENDFTDVIKLIMASEKHSNGKKVCCLLI
ncbi:ankyrin repeat protein, putative [Trichomonas vaginalis G3]|uniref:Ankyrin repeat protein, putative n=1 Tax=Trichomonas vaginalis (strain ATCC PRA-98 / G3) TaxID=412133 RepID=A2DBW5_TRIV3|nr:spectrin binding [Trichomonas vaginalis G3]EAY22006.1 ankyrin repeat protein, putative [Trichomonas vaginalis G3]KAI5525369.1 spectrin binding [Trichomonas vaginalis G3]|eukprot:XP_001582992.1 ankyrin repeat protein [Trichomonas vaginalis G3]